VGLGFNAFARSKYFKFNLFVSFVLPCALLFCLRVLCYFKRENLSLATISTAGLFCGVEIVIYANRKNASVIVFGQCVVFEWGRNQCFVG
jgi:FtsH-binding integral membrane protein